MDEIMAIARQNDLFVVEDVAQAFGATWKGEKLGSIGGCGAFSFFPSKNLGGLGDAGMIATNDEEIASLSRMLLKHGGKDKWTTLITLDTTAVLTHFKRRFSMQN